MQKSLYEILWKDKQEPIVKKQNRYELYLLTSLEIV